MGSAEKTADLGRVVIIVIVIIIMIRMTLGGLADATKDWKLAKLLE